MVFFQNSNALCHTFFFHCSLVPFLGMFPKNSKKVVAALKGQLKERVEKNGTRKSEKHNLKRSFNITASFKKRYDS